MVKLRIDEMDALTPTATDTLLAGIGALTRRE
jgi:hypothetical protein